MWCSVIKCAVRSTACACRPEKISDFEAQMTVFLDFWDSRGFLTYSSCLANIPILSWSTFVPKKNLAPSALAPSALAPSALAPSALAPSALPLSRRPLLRRPLSRRRLSHRPLSHRPLSHRPLLRRPLCAVRSRAVRSRAVRSWGGDSGVRGGMHDGAKKGVVLGILISAD